MSERPIVVTVCYSRCLYCGRRTPHETCHQHSEELHPGWWDRLGESADPDALWGSGRDKPDETCESGSCPLWEPGEWEARQRWEARS